MSVLPGSLNYLPSPSPATLNVPANASLPIRKPEVMTHQAEDSDTSLDFNSASKNAADFKKNLPGYLQDQYGGATDQAKLSLAKDIQSTKASANSRGLLYSGLEAGQEHENRAEEGSKLASNIEGINSQAAKQGEALQNNAVQQAYQNVQYETATKGLQAQAAQSAYEQALSEQQNQGSFWKDLIGGIGTIAGTAGAIGKGAGAVMNVV